MIYNGLHKHLQMVLNEQKCRFNPAKIGGWPSQKRDFTNQEKNNVSPTSGGWTTQKNEGWDDTNIF